MPTSVITNVVKDPAGTAVVGSRVVARLIPAPAFRTADGSEVEAVKETVTDGTGTWSLTLEETAGISPSNSVYEVVEYLPGGARSHIIQVGAADASLFSSLVTPAPPFDGATYLTQASADARYLQHGLVVFDVSHYGATGDGTTDDTAAVQAAIDAAEVDGGTVLFPQGTYLMSEVLVGGDSVTLAGAAGATLKAVANQASAKSIIRIEANHVRVTGLSFDGNGSNQVNNAPFGVYVRPRNAASVADISVDHCSFTATKRQAIGIQTDLGYAVDDVLVSDNVIDTTLGGGIYGYAGGSGWRISDNLIRDTGGIGIQIYGVNETVGDVSNVAIVGNVLVTPGQIPVELQFVSEFAVTGNTLNGGNRGFSLGAPLNGTIAGNVAVDQTTYFCEMNGGTNVSIVGNTAQDCKTFITTTNDPATRANPENITVTGNTCVGSGLTTTSSNTWFINAHGKDWNISGNIFRGGEYIGGIRLGSAADKVADRCIVQGNSFVVDTANAKSDFVQLDYSTGCVVAKNSIVVSRDLDSTNESDSARVIRLVMGRAASASVRDNLVYFTGNTAGASAFYVAIGSNNASAGTLAGCRVERNLVSGGTIGFIANTTSADFLLADNDGRTCTTEYSTINAAVIFRRTKRTLEAAAAPAAGTWATGDIVWNTAPSAGGVLGWACTAGGSPGTWVTIRAVAAQRSAYTQTYTTADKTIANPTAAALTVTDGAGTNDGTIGAITADASVIAAVRELAAQINKLVADNLDLRQGLTAVIDDLQAVGLVG